MLKEREQEITRLHNRTIGLPVYLPNGTERIGKITGVNGLCTIMLNKKLSLIMDLDTNVCPVAYLRRFMGMMHIPDKQVKDQRDLPCEIKEDRVVLQPEPTGNTDMVYLMSLNGKNYFTMNIWKPLFVD